MKYGEKFRRIRKEAGLSQKELGLLMGLLPSSAHSVISRIENNKKTPTLFTAHRFLSACAVGWAALDDSKETDKEKV